jgi:hypothetical protein
MKIINAQQNIIIVEKYLLLIVIGDQNISDLNINHCVTFRFLTIKSSVFGFQFTFWKPLLNILIERGRERKIESVYVLMSIKIFGTNVRRK